MTEDYSKYEGLEHGTVISERKHPDSVLFIGYNPLPGDYGRCRMIGMACAPSRRIPGEIERVFLDGNTEVGHNVSLEFRRILTMIGVQVLEERLKKTLEDETE